MYETIIIGAGICGMTAAMYAARKKMKYEILSTDLGGQFMVSGEVLNYPGIVKTTGVEFAKVMEEQMKFNGVKVKPETVSAVKKKGNNFVVVTDKGSYETQTVLIATGSKPRKIGVPGEEKLARKGVTYCSICDGPLFTGKEVAIIGGGSSALEAVDFMKEIAKKIYLVVKGKELTGHEYLVERVKGNKKVEIIYNAETTEILGDKLVSGLKYKVGTEEKELAVGGVIIEIGRIPNIEAFVKLVELDEHKHIQIDGWGATNVPGIYAAGDCASGHEYQYVISAGQGCMALLKAARYLASKK